MERNAAMRRIRTHCPRCGLFYDRPDLIAELAEAKEALRKLQRSVATHVARAALTERKRVERIIRTTRKGGSNE